MARGADTEAWMTSVRKKLNKLDSKVESSALPTIYRVPETIRRSNRQAYEPEIVSIGPYHRRKKRLQRMEKHKWQYLHEFLSRNMSVCLECFLDEVKKLEKYAQSFYSEHIPMRSCEFAEMMVLDGCFLIELFLKFHEAKFDNTNPIYGIEWVIHCVARDVLLAENQLPFVVLRCIYSFSSYSSSSPSSSSSLETLAMKFFHNYYDFIKSNSRLVEMESVVFERTHHLLHLVHSNLLSRPPSSRADPSQKVSLINSLLKKISFAKSSCSFIPICNKRESSSIASPAATTAKIPSHGQSYSLTNPSHKASDVKNKKSLSSAPQLPNVDRNPIKTVPSAKRLHEAGIKFKKKQGASSLDIKFSNGKMEIPYLYIDDNFNSLFRNLIAFEQICPPNETNFTDYVAFMDDLVNTSEDVEVLHKEGILVHVLGSNEEVAELFNQMCKGVFFSFDNIWFSMVTNDVIGYYNTYWRKCKVMLFRDYFGNPWSFISFLAAIALFVLTLLQTIYTMKV